MENTREWANFDLMAREFDHTDPTSYQTCEEEYNEDYAGKRFNTLNFLAAYLSIDDKAWVLKMFERGDHRFERFDISDFKVLDKNG